MQPQSWMYIDARYNWLIGWVIKDIYWFIDWLFDSWTDCIQPQSWKYIDTHYYWFIKVLLNDYKFNKDFFADLEVI